MEISSSFNNCYSNKGKCSFKNKPAVLPEFLKNIGTYTYRNIGMAEEKLLLASTACLLQPTIDIYYAQEDKKTDASIKSLSKAIAGGITGISIRGGLLYFINSKIKMETDKNTIKKADNFLSKYFFPEKAISLFNKGNIDEAEKKLKQYNAAFSGIIALTIMAGITNEKIDVPLTMIFQDFFTDVIQNNLTYKDAYKKSKKSCEIKIRKQYNDTKIFCNKYLEEAKKLKNKPISEIINENKDKIIKKINENKDKIDKIEEIINNSSKKIQFNNPYFNLFTKHKNYKNGFELNVGESQNE